ncbi:MAG: hypothetical protein OXE75_14205, partial [bacterium]|nr:hypothetical protein [bacterium]
MSDVAGRDPSSGEQSAPDTMSGHGLLAWIRRTVSDVGPGLFVILGLEILVFWRLGHPHFIQTGNFVAIGKRMAINGITAVGETIVI